MTIKQPELVAHRGYADRYPENTLLAIEAAVEAGARFVEFDVLLSSDQVPVLFHDRDCQRMCAQPGAVHEYSFAELQTFAVAQTDKFGDAFNDNRITSLHELVDYIKSVPHVTVFAELKRQALDYFGIAVMLDRVLPLLANIASQVVVISYSIESLLALRDRCSLPLGAVFDRWAERNDPLIKKLQPEFMFTDIDDLPEQGELGFTNSRLAVYECIDPQRAQQVFERGVDMVETFRIAEMLAAFAHD